MQPDWTSVAVSRSLWQLLDAIGKQTGLKKGVLIEKSVTYFVKENRDALVALGLDSKEIERVIDTLITQGLEFPLEVA